jgi:serine/threonine-protein kinase
MTDDPRVQQLLDKLLESDATPESVCASCPELLPVVRHYWLQMRRVGADLDVLFPPPTGPDPPPPEQTGLPEVPGYVVEGLLGRGGMGVVFKARHVRLNRTVALKMVLAGNYASADALVRFRREAEAVAALRHPHIVQVHDAGEVGGHPYFTMEFVEGGTLAHSLAANPLPPRRAAELLATLASAVQFAHKSGFIHRDLKPSNILLTPDGTPRITDFGLARAIDAGPEITRSGALVGTPAYVSPEQARGDVRAVGPAADIYALGAVLYEMLTGRPPFAGQSAAETIHKVVSEEPTAPSRLRPQVARDLETVCLKCLQKSPARRYASAQDLADDLHRFLDGKPVRARPVGLFERAVKWARRRPGAAVLVAVLLILLGTAVGAGVWLRQQERDRRAAKAERERQATDALNTAWKRAEELRGDERWPEALRVLTDASPLLPEANLPDLKEKFRQARSDFEIADELENARESYPILPIGDVDYRLRASEYVTVFEHAGLRITDDLESVSDHVRASAIREQFVAAIEDRAYVAFMLDDGALVDRLLAIARSADPGSPWRHRFRDRAVWGNVRQLRELAAEAFDSSPPPMEHQLALLGLLLGRANDWFHSIRLLGEACRRQPRNFWVNREMGYALNRTGRNLEAAGQYRVAVALRPENTGALGGLGRSLAILGDIEGAILAYRQALQLSPKHTSIRSSLVALLANTGYWTEAEAECRRGLQIDPASHLPLWRLADGLFSQGRRAEGVLVCREVLEIAPAFEEARYKLAGAYQALGRHEDALTELRKVKNLDPARYPVVDTLGLELAATGRWKQAIAMYEAAAARDPRSNYAYTIGKLYWSHGMPEEAATAFKKVASPSFHWGWEGLAAVRLDQGRFADAQAALRSWQAQSANEAERRALQRQLDFCDLLLAVEGKLPAILAGDERPADVPTQRALAEWCLNHKGLPATAARFYASALAAQPSLADNLGAGIRSHAARAAALAGCGIGADAGKLDDRQRAELRKQALDWLTAEYNAWAERHRRGKPGDRTVVATAVRIWLRNDGPVDSPLGRSRNLGFDPRLAFNWAFDPRSRFSEDLAGVRDEQGLARLPAEERLAWQALWEKVATLAARDPAAKFDQARAHVARLEWKSAARCYAEGMELEPTDNVELGFEYAASQLLAGDRAGYRRTCTSLAAGGKAARSTSAYIVARACTLAPDTIDDPKESLEFGLTLSNARAAWSTTEQAALRFRAGETEGSVASFERGLAGDTRPGRAVGNWLWLALAYQKLGDADEARRWLAKAANWLDQQGGRMPPEGSEMGSTLHNWLEAHVLRREAEALLR